MRIFAISQVKFLFIRNIQIFWIFLFQQEIRDSRIISWCQVKHLPSQSFFGFKWNFPIIFNFFHNFFIIFCFADNCNVLEWFCSRTKHCRPAYINKFDFFVKSLICLNFLEKRIKVNNNIINCLYSFFCNRIHMLLIVPNRQNSTMNIRMQCFYPTI